MQFAGGDNSEIYVIPLPRRPVNGLTASALVKFVLLVANIDAENIQTLPVLQHHTQHKGSLARGATWPLVDQVPSSGKTVLREH